MTDIIARQEERLRQAMLASDVDALDELIADDLQFVFMDGAVVTKQMDLESHRARVFRIDALEFSEQNIRRQGDIAVVTVKAELSASVGGRSVQELCRYLRVWALRDERWQIVAGSVSRIAK